MDTVVPASIQADRMNTFWKPLLNRFDHDMQDAFKITGGIGATMAGRRRADATNPMAVWLGAGAVTLGIGAALTAGAGTAAATPGDTGDSSSASTSTNGSEPSTSTRTTGSGGNTSGGPTVGTPRTAEQSDKATPATEKKRVRIANTPRASELDVATETLLDTEEVAKAGPRTTKRALTAMTARTAPTATASDITAPVTSAAVDEIITPTTASTTADIQPTLSPDATTPMPPAQSTARVQSATVHSATPGNPLVAFNEAVQTFFKNVQRQYFNTAPRITGHTAPTLNADGTYTGQIHAVDADGDPLIYSAGRAPFGSDLIIDQQGNYTLTPSAYALTREGTGELAFTVVEANADEHYHGINQLIEKAVRTALQPVFGQFGLFVGYVPENYAYARVVLPSTPWGNSDPTPNLATASPSAFRAAATPSTATNPLQLAFDNFQEAIQRTFFNSLPEVTLTEPTRNADGSYTGRIVATDADGDPLTISGNFAAGGTTTLDADGYYTYTPSDSVSSIPGFVHTIAFRIVEDNAANHFHGPAQIRNAIEATVLHALFGPLGYPPYSAESWGTVRADVRIPVGPPID